MSLDKYDGFTNPRKHVLNMHSNLELVIHESGAQCERYSLQPL
jgi:hypothetical protein